MAKTLWLLCSYLPGYQMMSVLFFPLLAFLFKEIIFGICGSFVLSLIDWKL